MPILFCNAIEAAATENPASPSMSITRPAVDIPDPAPHPGWQPATSAAKAEKFEMKIPKMSWKRLLTP